MADVAYYAPQSLRDAVAYRSTHPDATPFAGGTDLLVGVEYGKVCLTEILDLKALAPELAYIREEGGALHIGALTTISQMVAHEGVGARYPFLAQAASRLGSWQVRSGATVGGNLCNGAPSAELTPCWLVLDAQVVLVGPGGDRVLPVDRFLAGPGKVHLAPDELLKEIIVEPREPGLAGGYRCRKLRRSMDVAIVNMAVSAVLEGGRVVGSPRVALGAVGPVAFRVPEAEEALLGHTPREAALACADLCRGAARPIDDIRATAAYRREMVGVCMRELLAEMGEGESL